MWTSSCFHPVYRDCRFSTHHLWRRYDRTDRSIVSIPSTGIVVFPREIRRRSEQGKPVSIPSTGIVVFPPEVVYDEDGNVIAQSVSIPSTGIVVFPPQYLASVPGSASSLPPYLAIVQPMPPTGGGTNHTATNSYGPQNAEIVAFLALQRPLNGLLPPISGGIRLLQCDDLQTTPHPPRSSRSHTTSVSSFPPSTSCPDVTSVCARQRAHR